MKGLKVRIIGERGYSRSNKWILGNLGNTLMEAKTNPEYLGNTLMEAKTNTEHLGNTLMEAKTKPEDLGIRQQVEKGSATSGIWKLQQVEKVI